MLYSLPSLKTTLTLNHTFYLHRHSCCCLLPLSSEFVRCHRHRHRHRVIELPCRRRFVVVVVIDRWLLSRKSNSSSSLSSIVVVDVAVVCSLLVVRSRRCLLIVACYPPLSSILEAVMWREFELTCSNSIWFRVECSTRSVGVVMTWDLNLSILVLGGVSCKFVS